MIDITIKLLDHLNKEAITPIVNLLNSINIVIKISSYYGRALVEVEQYMPS